MICKRDLKSFLSSMKSSKIKEKQPSQREEECNSTWSLGESPHYTSRAYNFGLVSSNHVMVNQVRVSYGKRVLTRSRELDDLAHKHAQIMANQQSVFHSEPTMEALRYKLHATGCHVGENVHRGPSVQCIQNLMEFDVNCKKSKNNLISDDFTEFGMGTARSSIDGQLYMCQLFRVNQSS